jgi:eukaryotic-like serine/threonine-protein kinase
LPEILTVLTDVADALVALNGRVVHRDVKPEIILELAGKWCLADFASHATPRRPRRWTPGSMPVTALCRTRTLAQPARDIRSRFQSRLARAGAAPAGQPGRGATPSATHRCGTPPHNRNRATAGLLDAAQRGLAAISEVLLVAITDAAAAAQLSTEDDGSWRLQMGRATLSLSAPRQPETWSNLPIDIMAVTTLDLRVPPNPGGYHGRSHSLWFGDVQHAGSDLWFEAAFSLSAFLARLPQQDPFAMDPSSDAEQALAPGLHTHQVAWPFSPLIVGDLTDFVDRWASWFGDAADGALHRSSNPERTVDGSWRRS